MSHRPIASTTKPLTLSAAQHYIDLIFTENSTASLADNQHHSLHFMGIFGSTRCSNYEVYLADPSNTFSEEPLGVLGFYGVQPKSDSNPDGMTLVIPVGKSLRKDSERLTLKLVRQEHSENPEVVIITKIDLR